MNQLHSLPPSILLLDPDDRVRSLLKDNLIHWGYNLILALDEADALQRTQGGKEKFDLLLLSQWKQPIDYLSDLGQRICQQANLPHRIPIVIIAEQYGVELEGQNIQIGSNEYIIYLEHGQQLKDLLYKLCPI